MTRLLLRYIALFFPLLVPLCLAGQQGPVFVENKGQWPGYVLAATNIPGGRIYIENQGITFDLYGWSDSHTGHDHGPHGAPPDKRHVYKLKWLDAGMPVEKGSDPAKGHYNYFIGNNPDQWASGCTGFREFTLEDLYPGVDVVFYYVDGQVKYDFLLNRAADLRKIKWTYEGVDSIARKKNQLWLSTSVANVVEHIPVSYLEYGKNRRDVDIRYKDLGHNKFGFQGEGLPDEQPLVVDPTLAFSTLSGSIADNFGYTASFDFKGFLYSGSSVFANGYPTSIGAFDQSFNGGAVDIAITKWGLSGSSIIYSTYIGGSDDELPHSIITDENENLYLLGTTGSSNFPTTSNAFQQTFAGGTDVGATASRLGVNYNNGADIIIVKLSPDGTNLLSSTYFGGSHNDGFNHYVGPSNENPCLYNYADEIRGEIELDDQDNIYIASTTRSNDFPTTSGAFQPVFGGNTDGILAKIDNNLESILWCSYFGGSGYDAALSLQINSERKLVFAGGTNSTDLPTGSIPGAQPNNGGGRTDGFVAICSEDGATLEKSTYLGSFQYDQVYFADVDAKDDIYVFGQTEDKNDWFIQGSGKFNQPGGGQFITKFTKNLSNIQWSTVFGSGTREPNISPTAFLTDVCSRIFISGWGGQTGTYALFPNNLGTTNGLTTTSDAFQQTTDGSDFYLMVLDIDAQNMLYASFIGGSAAQEHVDGGTSRFDKRGIIYQAVCANCGNINDESSGGFPTSDGAYSSTNNSTNCNLAVFKFDPELNTTVAEFDADDPVCLPDPVQFTNYSDNGVSFTWYFGDGSTSNAVNPSHVYPGPGVYDVKLVINNPLGCNTTDSISKQVVVLASEQITAPDTAVCNGSPIQIGIKPLSGDVTYQWSPTTGLSNPNVSNPVATPTTSTTYTLQINTSGCVSTFQQHVDVIDIEAGPLPDTIRNCSVNPDIILTVPNSSSVEDFFFSYESDFSPLLNPGSTGSNTITLQPTEAGYVYFKGRTGTCEVLDSVYLDVLPRMTVLPEPPAICDEDSAQIGVQPVGDFANTTFHWNPTTGLSNPNVLNPKAGPANTTVYTLHIETDGCETDLQFTVAINPITLSIEGGDTLLCDGEQEYEITADGGGTVTDFFWSDDTDFTIRINDGPDDSDLVYIPVNTRYVYIRASNANCTVIDSALVEVLPPADLDTLGGDTLICEGESVQIGLASPPPAGYDFTWSPTVFMDDPNRYDPTVSPAISILYTLNVGYQHCRSEIPFQVDVIRIHADPLPDTITDCRPNPDIVVQVRNSSTVQQFFFSYSRDFSSLLNAGNTGSNSIVVQPDQAGYLYFKGTSGKCEIQDSIYLNVLPKMNVLPSTELLCVEDTVDVGIEPIGDFSDITFQWSPTTGLVDPNALKTRAGPGASTIYTLTLTSATCSFDLEFPVILGSISLSLLDDDTLLCDGDKPYTVTADGSGEVLDFYWSDDTEFTKRINDGPLDSTLTYIPDSSRYVYIHASSEYCAVIDSAFVEVFVPASLDPLNSNASICEGDSIRIGLNTDPPAGYDLTWTPTTNMDDPMRFDPQVYPNSTTTYKLDIGYLHCRRIMPFEVQVQEIHLVNFPDTVRSCDLYPKVTITVHDEGTVSSYFWSRDRNFSTIENEDTSFPVHEINPAENGYYYFKGTKGNCEIIDSLYIEVFPESTILPTTADLCPGDSMEIGVIPEGDFSKVTMEWFPEDGLSDPNSFKPKASPDSTTDYEMHLTFEGCVRIIHYLIEVDRIELETPGGGDTLLCSPQPQIDITANSFGTASDFFWSNDLKFKDRLNDHAMDSVVTLPADSTRYFYIRASTEACELIDSVKVEIFPPVVFNLSGQDTLMCKGDSVEIGVLDPQRDGFTYEWSPPGLVSDRSFARTRVSPPDTTVFTLLMSLEHCDSSLQFTVDVRSVPLEVMNDTVVCTPQTPVKLIADGNGGVDRFIWSLDKGFGDPLNPDPNDSTILVLPDTITRYYIWGEDDLCAQIDSVDIDVFPLLSLIPYDTTFCTGDPVQIGVDSLNRPDVGYEWNPKNNISSPTVANPFVYPTDTTLYTLLITYDHCDTTLPFLTEPVEMDLVVPRDTLLCGGSPQITLTATTGGLADSYVWADNLSGSPALNAPEDSSATVNPLESGYYYVWATKGGCTQLDSVRVNVFPELTFLGPDTSTCVGDSVRIGVEPINLPGVTYLWTPVNNVSSPTVANPKVSPPTLGTTSYFLTISYAHCDSTIEFTVTGLALDVEVPEDMVLCDPNPTTTVTADGNGTVNVFTWATDRQLTDVLNNPGIDSNFTISPTDPGYYYLRAQTGGCVYEDSVYIDLFPDFEVLDDTPEMCAGDSVLIGITPERDGITFTWSPADGLNRTDTAQVWASPDEDKNYALLMSYKTCDSTLQFPLSIIEVDFEIPEDTLLCGTNPTIVLEADGKGIIESFEWSPDRKFDVIMPAFPNDSSVLYTPDTSQYVYFRGSNQGCFETDSVLVQVFPELQYENELDTICFGDSVSIGATNLDPQQLTFRWLSPNEDITDTTLAYGFVFPQDTTTFRLQLGYGHCDSIVPFTVNVINLQLQTPDDSIICSGVGPVQLEMTATGTVDTYHWSSDPLFGDTLNDPVNSGLADVFILGDTTLYARVQTYVCQEVDTVNLRVYPELKYHTGDTLICFGDSVQIGVDSLENFDAQYSWSPAEGLSNPAVPNPLASPDKGLTSYSLTIDLPYCDTTLDVNIDVLKIELSVTADTIMCDSLLPLELLGDAQGTAETFAWSASPEFSDTLPPLNGADSAAAITPRTSGIYYLAATNGPCRVVDSTNVQIFHELQGLPPVIYLCSENDPVQVTVENLSSEPQQHVWSPSEILVGGNTGNTVLVSSDETTYLHVVSTGTYCSTEDSVKVTFSPITYDSVYIGVNPVDTFYYNGQHVTLTAESQKNGNYTFNWLPVEGFEDPTALEQDLVLVNDISFVLVGTDGFCFDTDTVNFKVNQVICGPPNIYIPNAFTPNMDGVNDILRVRGKHISSIEFQVFDRWGEMVFESVDQDRGWDGTFGNEPLNPAVFVYQLKVFCLNKQVYRTQGNVTLLR